jgi:endonuclease III
MSRSTDRPPRAVPGAALRRKTARITLVLEKHLGIPDRRKPLSDPLDMLIATMLSQNTNDTNSHRAYTELRRRFPSWALAAAARPAELRAAIRTGGMANQKAPRIREALNAVHRLYGAYDLNALRRKSSEHVIRELTGLHGVGTKTAACVLLFALGRDVFPVDTHVHRLCTRLGLAPGSRTPERTFAAMKDLVPRGKAHSLHTNFIRFGRSVCRTSNPRCSVCPLYADCVFDGKTSRAGLRAGASRGNRDFMLLDNV